jgi:DNA polymerase-3 subunit beta
MTITLLQENLQTSLNYLQKVLPSKPQLPILSSILLQIKSTTCTLAATDLYMGIRSTIPITSDEEGEVVVPGKQFREIINSLRPGSVTLSYENSTLLITSGKTKATLQCYSNEEYPPFPLVTGEKFQLSREKVQLIEKYCAFSASSDQTRPILTTILFEFLETEMKAVATDGFRLAVLGLTDTGSTTPQKLLVPSRALVEVSRIMEQLQVETLDFTVSDELKQILFMVGDVEVYVRLIAGEYPPYEKIMPSVFTTEVMFDKGELLETVKQALIYARDASNITQLLITEGTVKILATSPSLGTFEGVLDHATVSGESNEVAFNSRYLLDFLAAVQSDRVWFGMSDTLKPVLFRIEELEGFLYVVMPFKVSR